MKTLTRLFIAAFLAIVVGLLAIAPISAQSYLSAFSNTTLNGAITSSQTTLVLTSASAISGSSYGAPAAGQCIYVADGTTGELMNITAVSSTTLTVRRSVTPSAHATGVRVFTGACSDFKKVDPPAGACVQASFPNPWVNAVNGNIWRCRGTALTVTNAVAITFSSVAPGLPW